LSEAEGRHIAAEVGHPLLRQDESSTPEGLLDQVPVTCESSGPSSREARVKQLAHG
jgi:hypothetical protein